MLKKAGQYWLKMCLSAENLTQKYRFTHATKWSGKTVESGQCT